MEIREIRGYVKKIGITKCTALASYVGSLVFTGYQVSKLSDPTYLEIQKKNH